MQAAGELVGIVGEFTSATDEASVRLVEAAEAWESTAVVVKDIVDVFRIDEDAPPPEEDERKFDIYDYILAAERIEAAAIEVRQLLDDAGSDKLATTFASLDETSRTSIDHAAAQLDHLMDRLPIISIMSIASLVIGLLIYRFIAERMLRRHVQT